MRQLLRVLGMCLLLLPGGMAVSRSGPASMPARVRFVRGALSAHVRGRLAASADAQTFFVVKARKGDRMIVNIIPVTRGLATGGVVRSPSGKMDGQPGGIIYDHRLTETGDYTIRVARNLMAEAHGAGAFILEVVMLPSYLASPSP